MADICGFPVIVITPNLQVFPARFRKSERGMTIISIRPWRVLVFQDRSSSLILLSSLMVMLALEIIWIFVLFSLSLCRTLVLLVCILLRHCSASLLAIRNTLGLLSRRCFRRLR